MSRKWWIGNNGFKSVVEMLWVFQGVFLLNIKISIMHIVQYHIHSSQVVGRSVQLLSVKLSNIFYLTSHTKQ